MKVRARPRNGSGQSGRSSAASRNAATASRHLLLRLDRSCRALLRLAVDSVQVAVAVAEQRPQLPIVLATPRRRARARRAHRATALRGPMGCGAAIIRDDAIGERLRLVGQRAFARSRAPKPQAASPRQRARIRSTRPRVHPAPRSGSSPATRPAADDIARARWLPSFRATSISDGRSAEAHRPLAATGRGFAAARSRRGGRWRRNRRHHDRSRMRRQQDGRRVVRVASAPYVRRWSRSPRRRLVRYARVGQPSCSALVCCAGRQRSRSSRIAAGIAVALAGIRSEQLGRRPRAAATGQSAASSGGGRRDRISSLQPPRVGRAKWLLAGEHLVEQDADRPEVGVAIDVARLEPLGRQIRHAAEVVARDLAAQRQRLGDAEVEHLDLPGRREADVARLEIAVQQRAQLARRRPSASKRCASSRKRHSSTPIDSARSTGIGPRAIASDRFSPSRYSIAT